MMFLTPLPCAPDSLAGRSRHEAQGSAKAVGVRYPNPAQDTHLSYQLILPPLSTGPDQTRTREALGYLAIIWSCS